MTTIETSHLLFGAVKPTMARELGKSLNMAEGENLRLSCEVFGWPAPVINWVRLNPLINFVQPLTPNVTLADPRIVANGSLLTITPAIRTDYMVYACIAKNSVGFTNSTMLVRVKGQRMFIFTNSHELFSYLDDT